MTLSKPIGVIIIGRNEGERLIRCLQSVAGHGRQIVYVDSGSTDGSQAAAVAAGAQVVELDQETPFTAARARNEGFARIKQMSPIPEFVQFIDGDCELQPGWLETAQAFLEADTSAGAVCGRRRERFPEASVYNRLTDLEWDTPIGQAKACGGDALMRRQALDEVGGFNPNLIAGEEPELCIRLRAADWTIWRLDEEMTLHDAALTRFSQWWKRNRRAGHAFAEGAYMHGRPPENHGVRETRSAFAWGFLLPIITLSGLILTPWALILLLAWPLQMLRLWRRGEIPARAIFLTVGKLPEAQGIIGYWWGRLRGARHGLIEYK